MKRVERSINETQCKYKVLIFENDTTICTECLNELKQKGIIDKKAHN